MSLNAAPHGAAAGTARSATSSSTSRTSRLAFGGVKALTDISFDVREHEVRAIIGPNGAGKSSMLNCINGVYQPQQGTHHLPRPDLQAHELAPGGRDGHRAHLPEPGAVQGHERARQHHDRAQPEDEDATCFLQALRIGPGAARGDRAPRVRRAHHRLPRDPAVPQDAGGPPALRPAEARRPRPRAGDGAAGAAARRADGRHERRGEAGHVPLHPRRQRRVRHHHRADRARHGRGDGHLRPRGGARLRQQDRRRHARRGARQPRRDQAPTSAPRTDDRRHGLLPRNPARRPDGRHAVFAGRARLRADLQGLGRLQLRAGRDGAVRGAGDGALRRMDSAAAGLREQAARQPAGLRRRHAGDDRGGLADRAAGAAASWSTRKASRC